MKQEEQMPKENKRIARTFKVLAHSNTHRSSTLIIYQMCEEQHKTELESIFHHTFICLHGVHHSLQPSLHPQSMINSAVEAHVAWTKLNTSTMKTVRNTGKHPVFPSVLPSTHPQKRSLTLTLSV